jgi:hypothetical protein
VPRTTLAAYTLGMAHTDAERGQFETPQRAPRFPADASNI